MDFESLGGGGAVARARDFDTTAGREGEGGIGEREDGDDEQVAAYCRAPGPRFFDVELLLASAVKREPRRPEGPSGWVFPTGAPEDSQK